MPRNPLITSRGACYWCGARVGQRHRYGCADYPLVVGGEDAGAAAPAAPLAVPAAPARAPARKYDDPSAVREFIERALIVVDGEGDFSAADETPVHVGVAFDVDGYGPHAGVVFVDQNFYHASKDTALQGAVEVLEERMREDYLKELEEEEARGDIDDAWAAFTENIDGRAWVLSPADAVTALRGTDAEKHISITSCERCAEPATAACVGCGEMLCEEHIVTCDLCNDGTAQCADCAVEHERGHKAKCADCGELFMEADMSECASCGAFLCDANCAYPHSRRCP